MWALFAVASAIFLGTYDVFKKLSLRQNAVLPVLFFSTLTYAAIFLPLVIISIFDPGLLLHSIFFVPVVPITQHGYFLLKAVIVTSSWIFAFFAIKHLPLTIVSPIRATGPIWIILGAIVFHEKNVRTKGWLLLGILAGVLILLLGSR